MGLSSGVEETADDAFEAMRNDLNGSSRHSRQPEE
jgi:hypothetical protein